MRTLHLRFDHEIEDASLRQYPVDEFVVNIYMYSTWDQDDPGCQGANVHMGYVTQELHDVRVKGIDMGLVNDFEIITPFGAAFPLEALQMGEIEINCNVEEEIQKIQDEIDKWEPAIPTSLDDLLVLIRSGEMGDHDYNDWTSFPTFGGDEIQASAKVWSWDQDRVLIGTCRDDLDIQDREVHL